MGVTLETAAREAVTKVQPLLAELDEAAQECRTALGYVQALAHQLEADRKALQEAVAALHHEADDAEVQIADDGSLAASALGLFAKAARQAAADGPADLDAETAALGHAGTLLAELGPPLDEVAQSAEAASRAALEQATAAGSALGEAVDHIEQLVGVDLAFHVSELRQHLETAVGDVIAFLSEKCSEFLDKKEGEWREKLAAVRDLMETSVESVEQHTQEMAGHTGDKWGRLLDQEMAEVETEVQTLVGDVGSLTRLVMDKEGQLKVAAEMVEQRQEDGAQAATSLDREMEKVRGRWGLFGITC